MKSVKFKEHNAILGRGQEEYNELPAFFDNEEQSVTVCFELNNDELEQVGKTGRIYIKQLVFGSPFQPIAGTCLKSQLIPHDDE